MHYISTALIFFMTILIVIHARSSSSSSNRYRSCPEEYRELRRRRSNDDSSSDSTDNDQQWEDVCDRAMGIAVREPNSIEHLPLIRTYCPYFDEALALAREMNDTLCEEKKRSIFNDGEIKRKRQPMKKRWDDNNESSDDDDDDNKRRALRKRELHKRFALRFIRKRLS